MNGTLYVVATPIGNLEDITLRALRTLREVDLIACEDTRRVRKLLTHYGVTKPLMSYHEHNEERAAAALVERIESGLNVALVTDSGTPTVSDPGYRLLSLCAARGLSVTAVPGPSAVVAALSVSGLPCSRFAFLGFLSRGRKKKRAQLEAVKHYPETLVILESPRRTLDTLRALAEVLGDRRCAVCRELTKKHEEILRGTAPELAALVEARGELKGEVTLVVEGCTEDEPPVAEDELRRLLEERRSEGLSLKEAVDAVASLTGAGRNEVYRAALAVWRR